MLRNFRVFISLSRSLWNRFWLSPSKEGHFVNRLFATIAFPSKEGVKVVFRSAEDEELHVGHFDLKSVYNHLDYEFEGDVYVRELPRGDGSYTHEWTIGRLNKNL